MNYTLIDPNPLPADPAPILDQYIPTSHTAKVPIQFMQSEINLTDL